MQANYRGTNHIGKLGVEQSYERELHGATGFEEVETSAGGRAVRRIKSHAAMPGNTAGDVDRHPAAGAGREAVRRPPRCARGDGPAHRRGAGLREQAHLRPQPVRRRHRCRILARAQRVDRQAAAQPGPARHLPAGLDLQALHGAWRRSAPASARRHQSSTTAAPSSSATTPSAATATAVSAPVDMYRSIVKSSNVYYYTLANDLGVDTDPRPAWSRSASAEKTGIDIKGEVTGTAALDRGGSAGRTSAPEQQKWYAGETISLGIGQGYNNFTMLQMASATATAGRRWPALQAAVWCARSRTSSTGERKRVAARRRCRRCHWKPRARGWSSPGACTA